MAHAASPPTPSTSSGQALAENARMGHPQREWCTQGSSDVGHPPFKSVSYPGGALTVCQVGALSDFDDIAVRIADVAAGLAVLGDGLRDELRSSTFP